jgi:hypothetical protein
MAKKRTQPVFAEEQTCFTIMPFGGWFDAYYKDIYVPAIKAAGLIPRRADDLYQPSAIVRDIWSFTNSAKIVLADLSGKNPNVFYELGLAHAIAKPAILVTDKMDDVPFDLRALRVLVYDKNLPDWGKLLGEKITKSIQEIIASPLASVLPVFLDVKDRSPKASITPAEKDILEIKQDVELLKRQLKINPYPEMSILNTLPVGSPLSVLNTANMSALFGKPGEISQNAEANAPLVVRPILGLPIPPRPVPSKHPPPPTRPASSSLAAPKNQNPTPE